MTWRQKYRPHSHFQKYNSTCLRCRKCEVWHDDRTGIWWSLCLGCLSATSLGPFFPRLSPIGYDFPSNYKDEYSQ